MKTNTVRLEASTATSSPQTVTLERLEGLTLLAASVAVYAIIGPNWVQFTVLVFAPDLAMLGYLRGPRVGAITYNLAHVQLLPLALGAFGLFATHPFALQLALIWLAHIGLDRALGYGLKLETGFSDTTFGKIGRQNIPSSP
jgi:Domain of unknown function (DUF4260)